MASQAKCFLSSRAAKCRASAAFLLCLALLAVSVACSNDPKAAPTKQEITVDPNLLTVAHPELFQTVKVESRDLPTELSANGTIQPDVNKTIHVTSLGSGRVVDLKVRLGDYVKKGQELLVISSPDLAGAMGDYQKASADEALAARRSTAPNCSTRRAHSPRKIWRLPRTPRPKPNPTKRPPKAACAFLAEIPPTPAP